MEELLQTIVAQGSALIALVIQSLKGTFFELFTLKPRQALIFIFISYLIAYALYSYEKEGVQGETPRDFLFFTGGKEVYLHPSAITDYIYYFIAPILYKTLALPILMLIFLPEYISGDTIAILAERNLGPTATPIDTSPTVMLVYSVAIFILADFSHYWIHRTFHCGFLWEFHKVHHAAVVLNPLTAKRIHVVETLAEKTLYGSLVGVFTGIFIYMGARDISILQIFGAAYMTIIFDSIASNLRHSHVWMSFGPTIEHVINSPAQHQIHHSIDPKQYNKNFGTNLSIWDWIFGTLYVTSEKENITYGVTEGDSPKLNTLSGTIFYPFQACYQRTKRYWKNGLFRAE